MIAGKRILAVIPARGGSRGVVRKNLRLLHGKPLIAWTILAAQACPELDRVILSSDDQEIMATARQWNCEAPFVRPAHLSGDTASATLAAVHALETLPEVYDYVVLLQPTSPLRTAADIRACLSQCVQQRAPACVTVTATSKSPWWMYTMNATGALTPLMGADASERQRQELPEVYAPNGAVYVAEREWLLKEKKFLAPGTLGCIMSPERALDIDTELDLKMAQFLLENS